MLTRRIPPAFRDGIHTYIYIYRQPPSGQSRIHRVTQQLRTDGVHCRESAGTAPVVLKVVSITGAAFSGFTMTHIFHASLFPRPLYCYSYVLIVDTCAIPKVSEAGVTSTGSTLRSIGCLRKRHKQYQNGALRKFADNIPWGGGGGGGRGRRPLGFSICFFVSFTAKDFSPFPWRTPVMRDR